MSGSSERAGGKIRVTLVRSTIGRPKNQELTVRSLGLRKMNSSVELPDNDAIRGMVAKVRHLVDVQEVDE